jgi:hypothetical protein
LSFFCSFDDSNAHTKKPKRKLEKIVMLNTLIDMSIIFAFSSPVKILSFFSKEKVPDLFYIDLNFLKMSIRLHKLLE